MRIAEKFVVKLTVMPESVFNSAVADRIQARIESDEQIVRRVQELAEQVMSEPRKSGGTSTWFSSHHKSVHGEQASA